jgi:predicted ATP-binding protein involved in virulence
MTMKLKPVRFIGHNIGPFEHVELNWEKDSRYTLIVAGNGMGKTTLVAAMAACLSFGEDSVFPATHFRRFTRDKEAFAYFELELDGTTHWTIRWTSQTRNTIPDHPSLSKLSSKSRVIVFKDIPNSDYGTGSHGLQSIIDAWLKGQNARMLAAAYGVSRDLQQPEIREHQELNEESLKGILNPFAPIPSSEVFQWVVNQHVYHALALAENKEDEAQAYLAAIKRVERLLSEGLEHPITFQVERNPFRLEVRQNGVALTVDQLSDGTRSFLSWPLDYLMRASRVNWAEPADSAVAPGLILVDEIDAHLHPEWQRRVMPAVAGLLPETYIIATTHSPFVLGATEDAQVFQIRQDAGGRLFAQAGFDELYGYPADLVLEKAFVSSLYAPALEQKLARLSDLAAKVAAGDVTPQEKQEHDDLLRELAQVNPWLNNLLALAQMKGP